MLQRFAPVILYEMPDPAGGGGAAAVAEPPAPVQSGAPAPGQGEAGPADQNGDFWGMFPDVPEEHKALIEPVLRQQVLPYVNRLEEQLAPFKPLIDAGASPQELQGLLNFSQQFEANPLDVWIKMAESLQSSDQGTIHPDLDLEIVKMVALGQDPAEGEPQQVQPGVPPGQGQAPVPGGGLEGLPPHVQQMIVEMQEELANTRGQVQGLTQAQQDQQRRAQEQAQNRLFTETVGTMKESLKSAGVAEGVFDDDDLRSALITARGNAKAAVTRLVNQRSAILKGYTESSTQREPGELDLSGGAPPSPNRVRDPKDGFERNRGAASAFLKRQNKSGAQG